MEKITASIVAYNNDPDLLKKAIESFLKSSLMGPLMIVDNSPTDALRKVCDYPGLTYIFNGNNLGYGKGHNLAIKKYLNQSQYHLVLNPDVYFGPDVIEKLYHFMQSNTQAGLPMPKVLGADGSLQMFCKLLPSPVDLASRRFFPINDWFKERNEKYELKESGYDQVINVPFLSGCFMFLRTEALRKVGLFDERFFLYAEDTDLSRRVHQQFETLFFPDTEIRHVHARGSYKNFLLTLHNIKSAFQYFNKWGWFFDEEREIVNQRALSQTQSATSSERTLSEVKAA
jgi:GT2 family glycosyltransferase